MLAHVANACVRSLNGTFVNDNRLPKATPTQLAEGDEVCFSKDRNTANRKSPPPLPAVVRPQQTRSYGGTITVRNGALGVVWRDGTWQPSSSCTEVLTTGS